MQANSLYIQLILFTIACTLAFAQPVQRDEANGIDSENGLVDLKHKRVVRQAESSSPQIPHPHHHRGHWSVCGDRSHIQRCSPHGTCKEFFAGGEKHRYCECQFGYAGEQCTERSIM